MGYDYKAKMIHFKMKRGKVAASIWICDACESEEENKKISEKFCDNYCMGVNGGTGLGVNFKISQLTDNVDMWEQPELRSLRAELLKCIKKLDQYIDEDFEP